MGWQTFTKIPNGTRILNHKYDQCVALANRYHEDTLGLPFVPVGSAYEWWTRYGDFSQLRDKYTRSQTPVAGAIFVSRGGIYDAVNGHIGVVTGVRAGGFTTMEQNTGPFEPKRYVYRHFRVKDASVYGFLIPKDNPASSTPPAVQARKEHNMLMSHYDHAGGKNVRRWAVFGPGFWLELKTQKAANAFAKQLGVTSYETDAGGWAKFKRVSGA